MRILLIIIVTLTLIGCAKPQKIDLVATQVAKPDLVLPKADVLSLRKIDWTLITPSTTDKAFEKIKKDGRPAVLFGITDQGYENLSKNFSDMRAYMEQLKSIIKTYEDYYFESVKAIEYANKEIDSAHDQIDKANDDANKPTMWDSIKSKFSSKTTKVKDALTN